MPINRAYGWKRGLPSRRFPRLELKSYPVLPLQASLIPTGFLPPIWDQGQTGSCTGHGSTRAIAFARAKQGLPFVDLSRLFTYWNARVAEGDSNQDAGASVADVIAAAMQFGAPPYTDLPTDPSLVTVAPAAQIFTDALPNKAVVATRVWGANSQGLEYHVKHCIAVLGFPVVFGFTVYQSFESDAVASTGVVPMPAKNEQVVGGHCVVATAYDDATRLVTCDNSWNTDWGQDGRFQIPYSYIFDPDYADDFHAILTEFLVAGGFFVTSANGLVYRDHPLIVWHCSSAGPNPFHEVGCPHCSWTQQDLLDHLADTSRIDKRLERPQSK